MTGGERLVDRRRYRHQQHSWWDNPCQRWTVLPTDGGWVRLQNPNSGKVADVADCGTADGTNVRLWSWLNNHCQQWQSIPTPG